MSSIQDKNNSDTDPCNAVSGLFNGMFHVADTDDESEDGESPVDTGGDDGESPVDIGGGDGDSPVDTGGDDDESATPATSGGSKTDSKYVTATEVAAVTAAATVSTGGADLKIGRETRSGKEVTEAILSASSTHQKIDPQATTNVVSKPATKIKRKRKTPVACETNSGKGMTEAIKSASSTHQKTDPSAAKKNKRQRKPGKPASTPRRKPVHALSPDETQKAKEELLKKLDANFKTLKDETAKDIMDIVHGAVTGAVTTAVTDQGRRDKELRDEILKLTKELLSANKMIGDQAGNRVKILKKNIAYENLITQQREQIQKQQVQITSQQHQINKLQQ